MSQPIPGQPLDPAQVQSELHEVAELLRHAHHLDRPTQERLANLLDELKGAVSPAALPSAEMLHVAQTATQIADHLHEKKKAPLASARKQLQRAVARLELQAPAAADLARRLLDAIANLGI